MSDFQLVECIGGPGLEPPCGWSGTADLHYLPYCPDCGGIYALKVEPLPADTSTTSTEDASAGAQTRRQP